MASSAEESWQTDAATGDEDSLPSKMASPEAAAAPVDDPALKAAATMPFKVTLGLRLEAKDYNGLWYPAKVMDIDDEKQLAAVHFEGWSSRFDEWISAAEFSSRLRPLVRHSQRRDSEKSKRFSLSASSPSSSSSSASLLSADARTDFCVGEIVLARWTDCRMYPAKILVANPNSFDVVFYDGFRKTVQRANVKPMTREMRREFHLPDDGTAGTACLFGEKKKAGKQTTKNSVAGGGGGGGGKCDVGKSSKEKEEEASSSSSAMMREEDHRKGKKRKRTVTLESGGGAVGGEEEGASSASAADPPASSLSSSSSSSSIGDEKTVSSSSSKKGRGRPPIAVKEGAVGSAAKRPKRDAEDPAAAAAAIVKDEWKCNVEECGKTFRKESLLVYHLKYYHLEEKTGMAAAAAAPVAKTTTMSKVPTTPPKTTVVKTNPAKATPAKTNPAKTTTPPSKNCKALIGSASKEAEMKTEKDSKIAAVTSKESTTSIDLSSSAEATAPVATSTPVAKTATAPASPSTPIDSASLKNNNNKSGLFTSSPSATSTPAPPPPTTGRKRKRDASTTSFEDSPSVNSLSRTPAAVASEDDETTLEFATPASKSGVTASSSSSKYAAAPPPSSSAVGDGLIGDDERIRCVCQIYEVTPESGRMLRCGRCKSWQHSSCFILPDDEDDESYLCYICSHPPGIRESKRRLEEVEEYLATGELARFPVPKTTTATALCPTTTTPEVRQPMTYGRNDAAVAAAKANSLDTLAAVNLRGRDSQAGFFKAVGLTVNNVCTGVHRVNDCLHGAQLRMHRLKTMVEGGVGGGGGKNRTQEGTTTAAASTSSVGSTAAPPDQSPASSSVGVAATPAASEARSSWDRIVAAEAARIDAEHDAVEARLAAMEAEMDQVERLWDASEEFVSLPPAKKAAVAAGEEATAASLAKQPVAGAAQKLPVNGELENKFRIKRALRGLIDDLNQVQQIAFLQTLKQK